MLNLGGSGVNTEIVELSVFVNDAVNTLEEIQRVIVEMDQKMASSINDKSGRARDNVAQTWVEIFEGLKVSVNSLGGLLNSAAGVQRATDVYNAS